jgi:hypothetical protein
MMPRCETKSVNLHLAEIATQIAPDPTPPSSSIRRVARLTVLPNITLMSYRQSAPNCTRRKTSGSSCARIGSRTAPSIPTTKLSATAATPGTRSSISRGGSSPSKCAIGPMRPDHRVLVLRSMRRPAGEWRRHVIRETFRLRKPAPFLPHASASTSASTAKRVDSRDRRNVPWGVRQRGKQKLVKLRGTASTHDRFAIAASPHTSLIRSAFKAGPILSLTQGR